MPTERADSYVDMLRAAAAGDAAVVAVFDDAGDLEEIKFGGNDPRRLLRAALRSVSNRGATAQLVLIIQNDAVLGSPDQTFDFLQGAFPAAGRKRRFDLFVPQPTPEDELAQTQVTIVAGVRGRGKPRTDSPSLSVAVIGAGATSYGPLLQALAFRLHDRRLRLLRPTQLLDVFRRLRLSAPQEQAIVPTDPLSSGQRPPTLVQVAEGTKAGPRTSPAGDLLARLETASQRIEEWDQAFRSGARFGSSERSRQEELMRRIVEEYRPAAAASVDPVLLGRVAGLEARLARLFDALSRRDAAGPTQTALALLTALVLVPTLIAGVYGSNVSFPLLERREGFLAMLAFMLTGASAVYVILTSIAHSAVTGGVRIGQWPPWQSRSQDAGASAINVLLLGAGVGACLLAAAGNGWADPVAPSTQLALGCGAVVLLWLLLYEFYVELIPAWRENLAALRAPTEPPPDRADAASLSATDHDAHVDEARAGSPTAEELAAEPSASSIERLRRLLIAWPWAAMGRWVLLAFVGGCVVVGFVSGV